MQAVDWLLSERRCIVDDVEASRDRLYRRFPAAAR